MKILIIASALVNYNDDRGGVHEETGALIDPPKDVAVKLTEQGRALYVNKSDDPFKDGRFTASPEMVKAAEALAKANAKQARAAQAQTPVPPAGTETDPLNPPA